MKENYIQLKKSDNLVFKIITHDKKDTGETIEFDLKDSNLFLRYQDLLEKDKKNKEWLRNQMLIIEKRPDIKGKKLLSKNEEDLQRKINEFFRKEIEVYDMFLGKNGVNKLLYGRTFDWDTLDEIDEIIDKYILPKLNIKMDDIRQKIKEKYQDAISKNSEVLK